MLTLLKSYNAKLPGLEKLAASAPRLQGLTRGFQYRMHKNREKAAQTIQRAFKGYKTRKWLRGQNSKALEIGRMVRGFVTRRRMAQKARLKGLFERIRRNIATACALRMSITQKQKAATMLAAIVRGSKTRADAQRLVAVSATPIVFGSTTTSAAASLVV